LLGSVRAWIPFLSHDLFKDEGHHPRQTVRGGGCLIVYACPSQ
jgi:hypothetical protein